MNTPSDTQLTHLRNLLYEKIECAAVLLAEVRGDAAWRDTANAIVALDRLDQTVRSAQRTAVELATASGAQTWASVGALLGISRQAAHERFRRD